MLLDCFDKLSSFRIVLASQSENRQKILKQAGISNFEVSPSNFKEDLDKSLFTPLEYVIKTSEGKVKDKIEEMKLDLSKQDTRPILLITADTIVTLEGEVFEKPESNEHAFSMIKRFSGKTHQALTSVWVTIISADGKLLKQKNFTESTDVRFAELSE